MAVTNLLLLIHLTGAFITLAMVVSSFLLILLNKSSLYRNISIGLAGITLFQIVSGSLLSLLSTDSVLVYCRSVAGYMTIVFTTEFVLFWKMKINIFPSKFVFATLTASLIVILVTALGISIS